MDRCDLKTYPEIMTVKEAAKYLGKGQNFVYQAAKCGLLPSIRLGKSVRILRNELALQVKRP